MSAFELLMRLKLPELNSSATTAIPLAASEAAGLQPAPTLPISVLLQPVSKGVEAVLKLLIML